MGHSVPARPIASRPAVPYKRRSMQTTCATPCSSTATRTRPSATVKGERREEQFTAILDGCGHVACYPPAVQGPARPTRRATERGRHRPAIEHAGPSRGAGRIRRQILLAAHAWCLAQAGSGTARAAACRAPLGGIGAGLTLVRRPGRDSAVGLRASPSGLRAVLGAQRALSRSGEPWVRCRMVARLRGVDLNSFGGGCSAHLRAFYALAP